MRDDLAVLPITQPDDRIRRALQRAIAAYSEDPADDLRQLTAGLANGQYAGLLVESADGALAGMACWRPDESDAHSVVVEVLWTARRDLAVARVLVGAVWDAILRDSAVQMISARVREGQDALRQAVQEHDAVIFARHMMTRNLFTPPLPEFALPEEYTLHRWEDAHQAAVEAIAAQVQSGSVDAVVMPDARPERMAEALRRIRAGTYPQAGPVIPDATLVALRHGMGTVCGYIVCVDMGMLGFVMDVSVHPDHRRRGLGRALVIAAMRALREAGFPMIGLAVTAQNPAARLYDALGFTVAQVGETAIWWRDGRQLAWRGGATDGS